MCFPYFAKTEEDYGSRFGFFLQFLQDKWSCVSFITFIMIKDTYQSIKNLPCGVLSIRNPTFQFATSEAQIAAAECVAGIMRYLTKL
jgi:hypothetical protein